ncbi:MAG: hypothetical protein KO206_06540 [Methanomicrobiaceae archaeon]|uniref:Uncharacterized protein n=1 Tax=hydrocarbon metagenome TaxID=938273 RepID=A0A0W8FGH4_9ZZZZ|nr:hypothetical protein [Methanomicrobiaceae archaeon]MDD5418458.1 hypothetical protein [Methanomicrobiaceae archaeon]
MVDTVVVEIVGLSTSECGPFPCDETRTCGLEVCYPSNSLMDAVDALRQAILEEYGDRVEVQLTLLDEEMPEHIREIIEKRHPPLPIILVNGRLTAIGRISLRLISEEIEEELES